MLVPGLLFSYSTFGLAARFTADILNRLEVRNGEVDHEQYPIHEGYMQGRRGRRHRLTFFRDGRSEQLKPGYVKEMADQRWHPPFDIVLRTTSGILGTTIILDYSWVRVTRDEPVEVTNIARTTQEVLHQMPFRHTPSSRSISSSVLRVVQAQPRKFKVCEKTMTLRMSVQGVKNVHAAKQAMEGGGVPAQWSQEQRHLDGM
jgi:hypothetical protein